MWSAYSTALDDFLKIGGPDLDARARTVCADLGLQEALLGVPTAALSGGQAARASLLDEPTNDLDFVGLARLETFLDEHSRGATEFGGGWSGYHDARVTARPHADEDYTAYRTERERLAERAHTQRQWSVQGTNRAKRDTREQDKFVRHFKVAKSEKQAAKARATERAIARLDQVEKPWEGWDLRFQLAIAPRSGDVVVRLRGAVVERGSFHLGPVDLEIGWGERVAIVGPNGSGKTTLLLALLDRLGLAEGKRWTGPGVVVGEMETGPSSW